MVMELRQLEYFVAVVEEANFTRAARRCHVAQPGVSAQVRQLERELGQALLDRSGRTVRLTQAGAAVLPYARTALAAVDGAHLAVDELSGLVRGHLALGMVTATAIDVPALLATFSHHHPGIEITLSEANPVDLLAALPARRLDAAFTGLAGPPPQGVLAEVIADVALVAAVNPDHPLAAKTTITLDSLVAFPLIALAEGTASRSVIDQACARLGAQPQVAFEASDPHVLARLAIHGLGVAVLPEPVAHAHQAELHPIAITRPAMRSQLALAWPADGPTSPAARVFVNYARAALADPSTPPGGSTGTPCSTSTNDAS